jgi:hypothetical protein
LKGGEVGVGDRLGLLITRDIYIDYTAGVDVWWQEDGRKFDLEEYISG